MYGESYGTATLCKELSRLAENVRRMEDEGRPYEDFVDDAKQLMEGAMVLWVRLKEDEGEL